MALLCLASTLFSYGQEIQDESIVLYITFDEGKGEEVSDLSQYGNNGELKGDPEWVGGKYGEALSFEDNESYVEVPASDSLSIVDEITLMCWAYSTAWDADGDEWIDRGTGDHDANCYGLLYFHSNQSVYLMLGDGGGRQDLITPDLPPLDEWYHIAGTHDGKTSILYLNGEIHAEQKRSFAVNGVNTLPLVIGRGVERPQYSFSGMIDEVLVANRALDQNEIKSVMDGGLLSVSPAGKLGTVWGNVKYGY